MSQMLTVIAHGTVKIHSACSNRKSTFRLRYLDLVHQSWAGLAERWFSVFLRLLLFLNYGAVHFYFLRLARC